MTSPFMFLNFRNECFKLFNTVHGIKFFQQKICLITTALSLLVPILPTSLAHISQDSASLFSVDLG